MSGHCLTPCFDLRRPSPRYRTIPLFAPVRPPCNPAPYLAPRPRAICIVTSSSFLTHSALTGHGRGPSPRCAFLLPYSGPGAGDQRTVGGKVLRLWNLIFFGPTVTRLKCRLHLFCEAFCLMIGKSNSSSRQPRLR